MSILRFLMKQDLRYQRRIFILSLLCLSIFASTVLVYDRLRNLTPSAAHNVLIEDLSSIKYRSEALKVNLIQQETSQGLKVVYKDGEFDSAVGEDSSDENLKPEDSRSESLWKGDVIGSDHDGGNDNQWSQQKNVSTSTSSGGKDKSTETTEQLAKPSKIQRVTDKKIREVKDQVIRAEAYLNYAPPNIDPHLVKELKLRIREVERTVGEATKDSELSRRALQKMRSMETSLSKANHICTDCKAMSTKLRAMTNNREEQARRHRDQATYLVHLAARTTPKGLHCLSMQLTADYFSLDNKERKLSNRNEKFHDQDLYHYVVFTDNVLACAVVVNSTVASSMEPEKNYFHVVTDSLNLPAITMWFLLNPPGKASIEIQSMENFEWMSSKYNSALEKQYFQSQDPRYASALNLLRFYLPEIFPNLNKIVLLDHDVVVQRDLRGLWRVDMKGKVNAAVETCREGSPSLRWMKQVINFSDPFISKRFDATVCTWAFGMNVFNLQEWRRQDLTTVYHEYLQLGNSKQLWKMGSLPLGLVTFYNRTIAIDPRWHILGLGHGLGVRRSEIERATVIHYDGNMKPWLDIAIEEYKGYWNKYLNYDHPYLQNCNIHE
ncbi:probable galacturonosyltransferase 6 isoform X2 [Macadamia integrifolia]|uniref:probable galacturonosyltransferase 6 isoform X2 n=1 Tax=Macadamia integrifolia TaxID=60698 RepID=UPI001C4F70BA|nr:probable galacturonosyltransferase 6 isoform X2 [Macadamia integrifolia]